ncbi:TIGR04002 family protein [Flintibacter muris]|uniref:TIGR04002 family protein n=1 Tax=Flintibacter muris TaxID=2941327 RepID=UPI0020412D38|nr:TIGR04002 family protein [Flintibacter muris]
MLQKDKIHLLTITALFAAAIAVMTAYMLHIPIPTGGYIHLGDALIYLAACLLPLPYAAAAAAVGAGLADLLTAPMWVLPTLVIKAVLVLFFTSKGERLLCRRNLAAVVIAGLFSPTAYALAGCAMAGTMAAFVPQFLGTLVQGIGSGALFIVIAPALDGVKLKERMITF